MPVKKKISKKSNKIVDIKSFTVGFKNFGPISSGEIEVKPLTILIGPNNAGKSYAANLINSLLQDTSGHNLEIMRKPFMFEAFRRLHYPILRPISEGLLKDIESFIDSSIKSDKTEFELPLPFVKKIHNAIINSFLDSFENNIRYNFGSRLSDLISFKKENGFITTIVDKGSFSINLGVNENLIQEDINTFNIKIVTGDVNKNMGFKGDDKILQIPWVQDEKLPKEMQVNFIYFAYYNALFSSLSIRKYYLPASRSGLLQVMEWLTSRMFRELPYFDELEKGTITGNTALFFATLTGFREKEGDYYKIAHEMELEIIKGEIVVHRKEMTKMPRLSYRTESGKIIDLQRASSTVNELAPFIIYMKYILRKGDMLIFEEPEAHLHPANQRLLAKYLVRLIRNGVKLVITTHSEYLFEQLSHFIQLDGVKREDRVKKFKFGKDDYLRSDEVSVHAFNYDKRNKGFKINKIAVNSKDGIREEEFNKVIDALFDESVKIRRDLGIEK